MGILHVNFLDHFITPLFQYLQLDSLQIKVTPCKYNNVKGDITQSKQCDAPVNSSNTNSSANRVCSLPHCIQIWKKLFLFIL